MSPSFPVIVVPVLAGISRAVGHQGKQQRHLSSGLPAAFGWAILQPDHGSGDLLEDAPLIQGGSGGGSGATLDISCAGASLKLHPAALLATAVAPAISAATAASYASLPDYQCSGLYHFSTPPITLKCQ